MNSNNSDFNSVEPMQIDFEDNNVSNNENNLNMNSFASNNEENENFIIENPSLDLENYISNYKGMAKLLRLLHISDHCPSLRIEALRMAIIHIQGTYNVTMYQTLHKKLREALSSCPLPDVTNSSNGSGAASQNLIPQIDLNWIEQKSKKASLKLEKLDADLKNYKSNSIKESIRRGHDDLAEHYLECGDLTNSLKCFSRARDYCTSAKHVVNMCLNVIKVSIYLNNWTHVLNFVSKAENTPDVMEAGKVASSSISNAQLGSSQREHQIANAAIVTKLKCSAGLAEFALKKYKSAAKFFLQASFDHFSNDVNSEIISANNIAIYGGLCALATFDRNELQKNVISSSSFKLFLEIEPQIRDIIFKFYESKYASCLKLLDDLKDNLYLDMYIAPHIKTLYSMIRNRGLIQYFSPYASADLSKMALSFNTTVSSLENELMSLILDGMIQARIDSHNKILYAKNLDQRSVTFDKSLKIGVDYEIKTKLMILKACFVKNLIQVKNPQKEQSDGIGNSNTSSSVGATTSSLNSSR